MDKTAKIIIGLIVIVVLVWAGYSLTKPREIAPIKIGAILPLTGDLATYAEGMRNAINLAVENSGMKDKVQVIFEDDHGCLPTDAVSAVQKLINLDKVDGILGTMCTGSTLAIAPITEQNKIIVIAPSATGKNLSTAGDYVYRVIASDVDKSIAVAKYAYGKEYRKAALLFDSGQDALVSQRDDVKKTFSDLGGQIAIEESFISKDKDLRSQLSKIKNADPEIIFVGAMPDTLGLILKQAKDLGIKSVFISTDTSGGTQPVIDIAGDATNGLIFPFATTPDNKEYAAFINIYKTKYGQEPPAYAAEGYDAAMLLVKSLAISDRTAEKIKNELQTTGQNYYGASGIITFDENGDVQKPMIIKAIQNGQFVEIQ